MQTTDLDTWNRIAVQTFGDIAVRSGRTGFEAGMRMHRWDGLLLARVTSSPAAIAGVRRGAGHPGGVFVLYGETGCAEVRQEGRIGLVGPDRLHVLRADRPYDIAFDRPNRILVMGLQLPPGHPCTAGACPTPQGRELVGAFMQKLAQAAEPAIAGMPSPAGTAAGVLALGWLPCAADEAAADHAEARLLQAVERHLENPDLGARLLAHETGRSMRAVQLLFARRGTTATAYILECRLQLAARRLLAHPDRPVARIAFDSGFNDLSYFCRCFRRRFGCAAGQWRCAAVQDSRGGPA